MSSNEELPGDSFKEIIGGSISVVGGGAGTIGVVAVRNARNKGFIAGLKFNDIHYRNITSLAEKTSNERNKRLYDTLSTFVTHKQLLRLLRKVLPFRENDE